MCIYELWSTLYVKAILFVQPSTVPGKANMTSIKYLGNGTLGGSLLYDAWSIQYEQELNITITLARDTCLPVLEKVNNINTSPCEPFYIDSFIIIIFIFIIILFYFCYQCLFIWLFVYSLPVCLYNSGQRDKLSFFNAELEVCGSVTFSLHPTGAVLGNTGVCHTVTAVLRTWDLG